MMQSNALFFLNFSLNVIDPRFPYCCFPQGARLLSALPEQCSPHCPFSFRQKDMLSRAETFRYNGMNSHNQLQCFHSSNVLSDTHKEAFSQHQGSTVGHAICHYGLWLRSEDVCQRDILLNFSDWGNPEFTPCCDMFSALNNSMVGLKQMLLHTERSG